VFPEESFIPIPIDDPAEAARIIRAAIAEGAYEKRRGAVLEAKRLVLEKYNFWAQIVELVKSAGPADAASSGQGVIYGRHALRRRSLAAALEDLWLHLRRP